MFSDNIIPLNNPHRGRSVIQMNLANFNFAAHRDHAFLEKYLWSQYLPEEAVLLTKLRGMLSDLLMNPAMSVEYTLNTESSYPENFSVSTEGRPDFFVCTVAKWKEVALFKPDATLRIDQALPLLDEYMSENKGKKYGQVEYEYIHNAIHNFLMGLHSHATVYVKLWPNHLSIHLQTRNGDPDVFGIMIMLARPE